MSLSPGADLLQHERGSRMSFTAHDPFSSMGSLGA